MANKLNAEVNTNIPAEETKEKMDKEQHEKWEDIGKCANMEDKKTMMIRSLSEQTMKRRLSSKSLFSNLFSRKKVSF